MDRVKVTTARWRVAERLIWAGSAIVGLSVASFGLGSVYRALDNAFRTAVPPQPIWSNYAFMVSLGFGAILVLTGLTLARSSRERRLTRHEGTRAHPESPDATIAA